MRTLTETKNKVTLFVLIGWAIRIVAAFLTYFVVVWLVDWFFTAVPAHPPQIAVTLFALLCALVVAVWAPWHPFLVTYYQRRV
jgi:Kef-type K+ transport system membrane component KefB